MVGDECGLAMLHGDRLSLCGEPLDLDLDILLKILFNYKFGFVFKY